MEMMKLIITLDSVAGSTLRLWLLDGDLHLEQSRCSHDLDRETLRVLRLDPEHLFEMADALRDYLDERADAESTQVPEQNL